MNYGWANKSEWNEYMEKRMNSYKLQKAKLHVLAKVNKYFPSVTEVKDASSHIDIEVTSEDCAASTSKEPSNCALATACKREKYDGAIISLGVAYLITGNKALRYRVPSRIAREIVSFDRNHDFRPGAYRLNAPAKSEKMGATHKPTGTTPDRGPITKVTRHRTEGIRSL